MPLLYCKGKRQDPVTFSYENVFYFTLGITLNLNGDIMSETLQVAIIAASAAILGGVVTGIFTYAASVRQREAERYKRRLLQAYKDIVAFYRLEEAYLQALATEGRSADAIKRETRKKLREFGIDSPSEEATPQQCDRRAQELS